MALILVVDDEEDMRAVVAHNLRRLGHEVLQAEDGLRALEVLHGQPVDLVISDVMMPKLDGLGLCARVREQPAYALVPFLFVSAKGAAEDQYRGLRAGADDYITKPFELDDLLARVRGRLEHRARLDALGRELAELTARQQASDALPKLRELRGEIRAVEERIRDSASLPWQPPPSPPSALRARVATFEQRFPALAEARADGLVGDAPALLSVIEPILLAATGDDPVLIIGETGTGKTAVAELIWRLGPAPERPLITLNASELAAADPTIAMGKLFGIGKNSGLPNVPKDGQPGLLQQAHGGTLFIDEVALLPSQAQRLLLLPLEGRPFRPAVGTGDEQRVSVKFIFATNRDLRDEVEAGTFPRDLFERMAGETLLLPPLRARTDDIPRLVHHFLTEAGAPSLVPSDELLHLLARHPWPGNVRELRRVIRQALRRAQLEGAPTLAASHLPQDLLTTPPVPGPVPDSAPSSPFSPREHQELSALRRCDFRIAAAEAELGYSPHARTLSHRLRGLGFKALHLCAWNAAAAAALLAAEPPGTASVAKIERRLLAQLESLRGKSPTDPAVTAHLLAEHRPHALAALAFLQRA